MSQIDLIEKVHYLTKNNLNGIVRHMQREIKEELNQAELNSSAVALIECLSVDLTYLALINQDWQASTTYRAFASNYISRNYNFRFEVCENLIERSSSLLPPTHSLSRSRITSDQHFVEKVALSKLRNDSESIIALGLGEEIEGVVSQILDEITTDDKSEVIRSSENLLGHITKIIAELLQKLHDDPESVIEKQLAWVLTPTSGSIPEADRNKWVSAIATALLKHQTSRRNSLRDLRNTVLGIVPHSKNDKKEAVSFATRLLQQLIQMDYLTCLGSGPKADIVYSPNLHRLLGTSWVTKTLKHINGKLDTLIESLASLPQSLQHHLIDGFNFKDANSLHHFISTNSSNISNKGLKSLLKKHINQTSAETTVDLAEQMVKTSESPWARRAICEAFEEVRQSPKVRQFLDNLASLDESPTVKDAIVKILSLEGPPNSHEL